MEENNEVLDEDIIMPDEDIEDTPIEDVPEGKAEEKTNESAESDETKILEYLNKKGIKYNGEAVELKSLDDVVSNIQKGMNYDKLKTKTDADDTIVSYISEMASKMGLTPQEYIQQVKDYQKKKEEELQEQEVQKMIQESVPEETARRIVNVERLAEQLKADRAELQKQKEEADRKAKEDKEYQDFISQYPDVKTEEIPAEVFKEAKEIGLLSAYAKYENKILKEKLKTMEQNAKNASTSIVTGVTDGSPVEQESKDAFLEGFDSVI